MNDKIPQFWDKGIQVVDGCNHVSLGCKNCWSEGMAARFKRVPEVLTDGRFNGHVRFNLHLLEKAAKVRQPTVYAIWNDLYHEGMTTLQIFKAVDLMIENNQHTYLIITKRPERAHATSSFKLTDNLRGPQSHIWHIVTAENQAMLEKRIGDLLHIPGKRGVIIEPMLEGVNLTAAFKPIHHTNFGNPDGTTWKPIHQVILGPENGPGKRPFNPEWADSVKAQCEAAGVPFYRKDTGEGELVWRKL